MKEALEKAIKFIEDLKVPQNIDQAGMQIWQGSHVLETCRAALDKHNAQLNWPFKILTATEPDDAAVDRFADAMKEKLKKKREQDGFSGWDSQRDCRSEDLAKALIKHTMKGDPVDVANFAMMLHQRNAMGIENIHIANNGKGVTILGFVANNKIDSILDDRQKLQEVIYNIYDECKAIITGESK